MDQHWKQKTLSGNQAHQSGDFEAAMSDYRAAVRRAKQLFMGWLDREEAVAAVMVSYHNVATCYEAQSQFEMAMHWLNACVDYLREARAVLSDDESMAALDHGLARSYAYLLTYRQRCYNGMDTAASDAVNKVLH